MPNYLSRVSIGLGRDPRGTVPAGWRRRQTHNWLPVTAEKRIVALLAAWQDPRPTRALHTQIASRPPLVFQEVVAWRHPQEQFKHRPAARLVWASPDSPDAVQPPPPVRRIRAPDTPR